MTATILRFPTERTRPSPTELEALRSEDYCPRSFWPLLPPDERPIGPGHAYMYDIPVTGKRRCILCGEVAP